MAQEQVDDQQAPSPGEPTPPVLLLGVSGGPHGDGALAAAAQLARRLGMTVLVAYVQPTVTTAAALGVSVPDDTEELELAVLLRASRVLDPLGVPWRFVVATGDPARGLHQLAETHDAALVVVGAPCRTRFAGLWRGLRSGVAHRLLHQESRPVLTVPAAAASRPA